MNRYTFLAALGLLVLAAALPLYALREPARLAEASAVRREAYGMEGAALFVDNCARCHGPVGEGAGAMPALNTDALAGAEERLLFQVIARAAHGTLMAAWHAEEGGILNDYQVGALVVLIRDKSWENAARLSAFADVPASPDLLVDDPLMTFGGVPGPHDCVSCHEEPVIHADRFGLNCASCHTLQAWTPAQLTRHPFSLDHGAPENQPCQTCHLESYVTYTCYQCHDHQPEEMETLHLAEGIVEFEACVDCHPTGLPGEAGDLTSVP